MSRIFIALLPLFLSPLAVAKIPCDPVDDVTPICELVAPEDLVAAPGGRYLLFSQMSEGAGIGILDTTDDSASTVMPGENDIDAGAGEWGARDCPGSVAGEMLLHGLDLTQRADGRWQLLATNHGGRESVEFFEVLPATDGPPAVEWRGCAVTPDEAYINDVAALPDGGFLTTQMFDRSSGGWGAFKAMLGFDTGFVYRWDEATGYQPLPGTEGPFPNGIAASADGEYFFVNLYFGGEVRKYRTEGALQVGSAEVANPDNSSWSQDGKLLVASHRYGLTRLLDAIPPSDGGPAELRFAIVEIDPDTMDARELRVFEGAPMGAGTVALDNGDYIYIGSFVGDRMIRIPRAGFPW